MSHNSRSYERSVSTSSTLSGPSTIAANDGQEEQDLSQASHSSRIVNVSHNAANAHDRTRAMVAKIEAIFESMVDVLTEGGENLTIPYRCSSHPPQRPLGSLNFPGKNLNEATKFSELAQVILRSTLSSH